jgi:hypothetical protein
MAIGRISGWLLKKSKERTMAKNLCAKRVEPDGAYEVWQSFNGRFTYFVLKKYQTPEKEASNPYARWYCLVKTPVVPNGEYSDVYVTTVKRGTHRIDNPLHRSLCVKGTSIKTLDEIGLSSYPVTELVLKDARLKQYLKLSIPPNDFGKVKLILAEHEIAIVCVDTPDFVDRCLMDVQIVGSEG